ncbi:replication initiation protein [Cytophagaceae bacterium YF14B1]|uniref:Replication initiation protein n=1 Tax=Xanthocytophaga flava TaxID=3048013 RepID=A0AAE3QV16_9BACT|nr:replication initiation protein [Xanthocytophaga flavus]MDJ1485910.1 replication initiation protein [Xanthocytophaga flavus]
MHSAYTSDSLIDLTTISDLTEVRQHNIITESRFEMSACQLDLFFFLLYQLDKNDEPGKKYWIYVKDIMTVTSRDWNYAQCKDATRGMMQKVIEIEQKNGNLLQVALFASCEYIKGKGLIEVEISDKIRPYLINIKEEFTSFKLLGALNMPGKYAKRIYIMLSQWRDQSIKKFTIDEFKTRLKLKDPEGKIPEKYTKVSHLKDIVLDPAIKEINQLTDLKVSYEFKAEGTGKRFTMIYFYLNHHKPDIKQIPLDFKESDAIRIEANLKEVGIVRADVVKKIIESQDLKKKFAKWFYDWKTGKFDKVKMKNPAGYCLKTIGIL